MIDNTANPFFVFGVVMSISNFSQVLIGKEVVAHESSSKDVRVNSAEGFCDRFSEEEGFERVVFTAPFVEKRLSA